MVPDQLRAKLRMTCIPVISVVFVILKYEGSTEIYKECNFEQKLFIENKIRWILLKNFLRPKLIHLAEVFKSKVCRVLLCIIMYYYVLLLAATRQISNF